MSARGAGTFPRNRGSQARRSAEERTAAESVRPDEGEAKPRGGSAATLTRGYAGETAAVPPLEENAGFAGMRALRDPSR